jgi:hypothetical protein
MQCSSQILLACVSAYAVHTTASDYFNVFHHVTFAPNTVSHPTHTSIDFLYVHTVSLHAQTATARRDIHKLNIEAVFPISQLSKKGPLTDADIDAVMAQRDASRCAIT